MKRAHLLLTDRLFAVTVGRLIPRSVHPNHLTLLRLVLIPFVLDLLLKGEYAAGVPLFFFAALTDWFDGALARTRRLITPWGVLYDPVVDKLLVGTVLFFVLPPIVGLGLCLAIFVIEAALLVAGWWRSRDGKVRPAGRWGKAKMVAEAAGITFALLGAWFDAGLLVEMAQGTLVLAFILALCSIIAGLRQETDV